MKPKQPILDFYITTESEDYLRGVFLNLRFSALISIPNIINSLGEDYHNLSDCNKFILNKTIVRQIEDILRRKRFYSIIYCNPYIDYNAIKNIHEMLGKIPRINRIVLLDHKEEPKNEELWQFFSEVAFFPSIKKTRIIDLEYKSI